jgi:hypothetical protein
MSITKINKNDFDIKEYAKKYKCAYGISSLTDNNKHVFMLDFDDVNKNIMLIVLRRTQLIHNLSDIYIIKSTHGFNVISFDKLTLNAIKNLSLKCNYLNKLVDADFIKYGFQRGYYCLRFGADKELFYIMKNDSVKFEKSLSHAQFIEWFFKIEIKKDYTFDDNSKIDIIKFPSKKHGFHEIEYENTEINLAYGR